VTLPLGVFESDPNGVGVELFVGRAVTVGVGAGDQLTDAPEERDAVAELDGVADEVMLALGVGVVMTRTRVVSLIKMRPRESSATWRG